MRRITSEIQALLLAQIRAGSYPQVAAEAAGVPRYVFVAWLQKGRQQSKGRYRELWLVVRQAKAQARAKAEIDARQEDVRFWLRHGPAKRGWTAPAKGQRSTAAGAALSAAVFFKLLGEALQALLPFPEARAAIVQRFDLSSQAR
jgi:hypothetical protein